MKAPLDEVRANTVKLVMAYAGDEQAITLAITKAITDAVMLVKDNCASQVTSVVGLSEQGQEILEKIEEKVPTSSISTDLLSPLNILRTKLSKE
jgi:hypothetical protein